jgi:hypothetical protein
MRGSRADVAALAVGWLAVEDSGKNNWRDVLAACLRAPVGIWRLRTGSSNGRPSGPWIGSGTDYCSHPQNPRPTSSATCSPPPTSRSPQLSQAQLSASTEAIKERRRYAEQAHETVQRHRPSRPLDGRTSGHSSQARLSRRPAGRLLAQSSTRSSPWQGTTVQAVRYRRAEEGLHPRSQNVAVCGATRRRQQRGASNPVFPTRQLMAPARSG